MSPSVLLEEGVDWFERGGDGFAAVMLALNTTFFVCCLPSPLGVADGGRLGTRVSDVPIVMDKL